VKISRFELSAFNVLSGAYLVFWSGLQIEFAGPTTERLLMNTIGAMVWFIGIAALFELRSAEKHYALEA
jgi:hypothetical protein